MKYDKEISIRHEFFDDSHSWWSVYINNILQRGPFSTYEEAIIYAFQLAVKGKI